MVELEQMSTLHKDFVDYIEKHIPEDESHHTVPVSEAPWDSVEFAKIPAIDKDPGNLYHYATLRTQTAGLIIEVLCVSAGPAGEFEVDGMSGTAEFTEDAHARELPKFIRFFDRLLGEQ